MPYKMKDICRSHKLNNILSKFPVRSSRSELKLDAELASLIYCSSNTHDSFYTIFSVLDLDDFLIHILRIYSRNLN